MEHLSDKWRAKIKTTSDDYVPKEDLTRAVASQIGSFNGSCIAACGDLAIFAAKHSEEYDVRRMELIVTLLDASYGVPPLILKDKDIPANGETFFWNGNLDNFGNDYILFVFIAFKFIFVFIEKSYCLLLVPPRHRRSLAVSIKLFK